MDARTQHILERLEDTAEMPSAASAVADDFVFEAAQALAANPDQMNGLLRRLKKMNSFRRLRALAVYLHAVEPMTEGERTLAGVDMVGPWATEESRMLLRAAAQNVAPLVD
ncbi:MAG TPA: hypothetical protein VMW52_06365 [Phycisphaerae bacterium]|nr:hypothetical protein [Phycisphaerae bacterium]